MWNRSFHTPHIPHILSTTHISFLSLNRFHPLSFFLPPSSLASTLPPFFQPLIHSSKATLPCPSSKSHTDTDQPVDAKRTTRSRPTPGELFLSQTRRVSIAAEAPIYEARRDSRTRPSGQPSCPDIGDSGQDISWTLGREGFPSILARRWSASRKTVVIPVRGRRRRVQGLAGGSARGCPHPALDDRRGEGVVKSNATMERGD